MTIGEAITLLVEEYSKASKAKWVWNPVAYALYQVWKVADEEGGE